MMPRKKTTVYLDEEVLRQTKVAAARSGQHEYEVVEAALRHFLGLEVVDRVWERNATKPLDPDEALALAYSELRAMRVERDSAA
jgi:Arc/MetJ family transcription regulator